MFSSERNFFLVQKYEKTQNSKKWPKIHFLSTKSQFWHHFYFFNFKSWRNKSGLRILILWVKSWFFGHFWFLKKSKFFSKNKNQFFGHNFLPRHPNHLISSLVTLFFYYLSRNTHQDHHFGNKAYGQIWPLWPFLPRNGQKINFLPTKSKFWDHFYLFNF